MANFKVGDVVTFKGDFKKHIILDVSATASGEPSYLIKLGTGNLTSRDRSASTTVAWFGEGHFIANSSVKNSVVHNALASRIRNSEFKAGDFVAVFRPDRAGQYFKVVEQADGKSLKVIDLNGVWAPKGGIVYVPVSESRKVREAETGKKVVKVDINPSKYKDANEKMRIIGSIWRELEGKGFHVVRTGGADIAFECASGDMPVVKKMFPSSYFTISNKDNRISIINSVVRKAIAFNAIHVT